MVHHQYRQKNSNSMFYNHINLVLKKSIDLFNLLPMEHKKLTDSLEEDFKKMDKRYSISWPNNLEFYRIKSVPIPEHIRTVGELLNYLKSTSYEMLTLERIKGKKFRTELSSMLDSFSGLRDCEKVGAVEIIEIKPYWERLSNNAVSAEVSLRVNIIDEQANSLNNRSPVWPTSASIVIDFEVKTKFIHLSPELDKEYPFVKMKFSQIQNSSLDIKSIESSLVEMLGDDRKRSLPSLNFWGIPIDPQFVGYVGPSFLLLCLVYLNIFIRDFQSVTSKGKFSQPLLSPWLGITNHISSRFILFISWVAGVPIIGTATLFMFGSQNPIVFTFFVVAIFLALDTYRSTVMSIVNISYPIEVTIND